MVNVVDVFKINHNSCNIFQNPFLLTLHELHYKGNLIGPSCVLTTRGPSGCPSRGIGAAVHSESWTVHRAKLLRRCFLALTLATSGTPQCLSMQLLPCTGEPRLVCRASGLVSAIRSDAADMVGTTMVRDEELSLLRVPLMRRRHEEWRRCA